MLSISSTLLITEGRSTSATTCGTSPWKDGIKSYWKTYLPQIDLVLLFERKHGQCSKEEEIKVLHDKVVYFLSIFLVMLKHELLKYCAFQHHFFGTVFTWFNWWRLVSLSQN